MPSTAPTCGVGTYISSWGCWVSPKAVDSWSLSQGFQHLGVITSGLETMEAPEQAGLSRSLLGKKQRGLLNSLLQIQGEFKRNLDFDISGVH